MNISGIDFPMDRIRDICLAYGASRLSLFGSLLTATAGEASDVDLLVEFAPGVRIGLIGLANMEAELAQAIGRDVDLRTPAELSPHFRSEVVRSARPLHAA